MSARHRLQKTCRAGRERRETKKVSHPIRNGYNCRRCVALDQHQGIAADYPGVWPGLTWVSASDYARWLYATSPPVSGTTRRPPLKPVGSVIRIAEALAGCSNPQRWLQIPPLWAMHT